MDSDPVPTRIPITICHGINPKVDYPLTEDNMDVLVRIVHELGFESIDYDGLG